MGVHSFFHVLDYTNLEIFHKEILHIVHNVLHYVFGHNPKEDKFFLSSEMVYH